jgi:hypothetical protein
MGSAESLGRLEALQTTDGDALADSKCCRGNMVPDSRAVGCRALVGGTGASEKLQAGIVLDGHAVNNRNRSSLAILAMF